MLGRKYTELIGEFGRQKHRLSDEQHAEFGELFCQFGELSGDLHCALRDVERGREAVARRERALDELEAEIEANAKMIAGLQKKIGVIQHLAP